MTAKYLTTDPHSKIPLEKGKRYFMDFDISSIPMDERGQMTPELIRSGFISTLRERGHEVSNVIVSIPHDAAYPNTLRLEFTVENPLWVVVIVALAIGVLVVSIGAGYGLFAAFKGLGELPVAISEKALKNPIAVIAILVAVAIFILGRKF